MAISGEIEQELEWFPVAPGDVIDVPCGTIHAIGGGVTLYEVQQPADITWRLYDWGRGRELHLDDALEVARTSPAAGPMRPRGPLISGPIFNVWRAEADRFDAQNWRALTCTAGSLLIDGGEHGDFTLVAGDTALVGPGRGHLAGDGSGLWASCS